MGDITEEKFISTLISLGYRNPSKFSYNWIITNGNVQEFLQWFCENVNSSNCLSSDELEEYNQILASGDVVEGDELEYDIECFLPNFKEINGKEKKCLNESLKELAEIKNYSGELEVLQNKILEEMSAVDARVNELKNRNTFLQKKTIKIQEECMGDNELMESSFGRLRENINNAIKYASKPCQKSADLQFVSEFPLDKYIEENTIFKRRLNSYIDENLCRAAAEKIDEELEKLREGYESNLLLRLKEESKTHGLKSSCEYLKEILRSGELWKLTSCPSSVMQLILETERKIQNLKLEVGDLKLHAPAADNVEQRNDNDWGGWWSKAADTIKVYASYQFNQVSCAQLEAVLMEKAANHRAIKNVLEILKSHCALHVAWMLIIGDEITRVKCLSKLVSTGMEYLQLEQNDGQLRINLMEDLKGNHKSKMERTDNWLFLHSLLNFSLQNSKINEPRPYFSIVSYPNLLSSYCGIESAIHSLVGSCEGLSTEIKTHEESLYENIIQHSSLLNTRWNQILPLKSKVFSGSTSSNATLYPVDQVLFIHQNREKCEEIERRLKDLKRNIMAESTKENTLRSKMKSLWVVFVNDPESMKNMVSSINK